MFKTILSALMASSLALGAATTSMAADLGRVDILVPSGAGGGWDQTGRAVQQSLRVEKLAGNIQVTNVPGAGGTIGLAQFITTKQANPHALLVGGFTLISSVITNKSAVSLANVAPIARLTGEYEMLVVAASSPVRNMGDLIAKLKDSPRSVSWAGGSAGSTDHVLAALVAEAVGVDPSKVNYIPHAGGGEAMTSILGGHVTVGIGGWNEYEAQIKDGKLRAIGVASPARLPGINVATFKEQGVNVELANWRGLFAPPGLSPADVAKLSDVIDRLAKSPTWAKAREERGWLDYYLPRAEFEKFIAAQQVQMQKTLVVLGLVK